MVSKSLTYQRQKLLIEESYKQLYTIVQNGGTVLLLEHVNKTQRRNQRRSNRCNQYYVDQRWLGGTLTNFKTIKKSNARLGQIEEMENTGVFDVLPKKEVAGLKKEQEKLLKYFSGIRTMKDMPAALFVVDPKTEHNAVAEAHRLSIQYLGLLTTQL
jgi:small subunit ribosomal protein S2